MSVSLWLLVVLPPSGQKINTILNSTVFGNMWLPEFLHNGLCCDLVAQPWAAAVWEKQQKKNSCCICTRLRKTNHGWRGFIMSHCLNKKDRGLKSQQCCLRRAHYRMLRYRKCLHADFRSFKSSAVLARNISSESVVCSWVLGEQRWTALMSNAF